MANRTGAEVVTVEASARALNRSASAVRRYIAAGKLEGLKMPDGHYEVNRESLLKLARQMKPRGSHSVIRGGAVRPEQVREKLARRQNRFYGGEKTEAAKEMVMSVLSDKPMRQSECTRLVAEKAGVSEITARYALKALLGEKRITQTLKRKGGRAHASVTYRISDLVKAAAAPAPPAAAPAPRAAAARRPGAKVVPMRRGEFPAEAMLTSSQGGVRREYVLAEVAGSLLADERQRSAQLSARVLELEGQLTALEARIAEFTGSRLAPVVVRSVTYHSGADGDTTTIVTDAVEPGAIRRGNSLSLAVNA